MVKIVLATHNEHKLQEIQQILGVKFVVEGLHSLGIHQEIPETGKTFEENAFLKASFAYKITKNICVGDDSGLVIPSLGGRPGIFSARYAGNHNFEANMEKVLNEMQDLYNEERVAYFTSVLCLHFEGITEYFEGRVYGHISREKSGCKGFGYDPIFIPKGYKITFAEMLSEQKNKISHRFFALEKLQNYLTKNFGIIGVK